MPKVIPIFDRATDRLVCGKCNGDSFRVIVMEYEGEWVFNRIVCLGCGVKIKIYMTPVFKPFK